MILADFWVLAGF